MSGPPLFKPPKEKDIERAICDLLAARNFFFWKNPQAGYFDARVGRFRKHTSPYVMRGTPDIIIVYKGQFIGLEVKAKKGIQSPDQREFEEKCQKNGGRYFIVRSVEDVMKALDFL